MLLNNGYVVKDKLLLIMTQEDNFTLQEKIESVMNMLNTPIFRRRIGNEEIIKLIVDICQEMGITHDTTGLNIYE